MATTPNYCKSIYAFLLCVKRARENREGVLSGLPLDVAKFISAMVKADALASRRHYRVYYSLVRHLDGALDEAIIKDVAMETAVFGAAPVFLASDENGSFVQSHQDFEIYDDRDVDDVKRAVEAKRRKLNDHFEILEEGGSRGSFELKANPQTMAAPGIEEDGMGFDECYAIDEHTIRDQLENPDDITEWRCPEGWGLYHEGWFRVANIK